MANNKRLHWRTIIGSIVTAAGIAMKLNRITAPMSEMTVMVGTMLLGYGIGNWRGNEGKL